MLGSAQVLKGRCMYTMTSTRHQTANSHSFQEVREEELWRFIPAKIRLLLFKFLCTIVHAIFTMLYCSLTVLIKFDSLFSNYSPHFSFAVQDTTLEFYNATLQFHNATQQFRNTQFDFFSFFSDFIFAVRNLTLDSHNATSHFLIHMTVIRHSSLEQKALVDIQRCPKGPEGLLVF